MADPDAGALIMAAEEAEEEARAAEATALAAQARARAVRLRRRAGIASAAAEARVDTTADSTDPEGHAAGDDRDAVADRAKSDAATTVDCETNTADDIGEPGYPGSAPAGDDSPGARRLHRVRAALRRPSRTGVVATASALIVAALIVSAFSVWKHQELAENDRRATEFVSAARQGVIALTSLDFNRAEDDVQRVLDESTGAFRDDFQARAVDFTNVIQQSQVTTEGKVTATALESMTDDSAVVLVAATSEVTNAAGAKQEPRAWRLSVTVSRVDGQLKMSKVEFVP